MSNYRAGYIERYIGGIDKIETGRLGGISDDKWLVLYYNPKYGPILIRYLSFDNEQVRAETIMLLTDVKEPLAADTIRKMSTSDTEKVRGACIGYLAAVSETEELIPQLMKIIKYKRGEEFSKAALTLGSIGRDEDIEDIRNVLGQVKGEMREEIRNTLSRIIYRYPDLKSKRDFILSIPVRPDEDAYDSFINRSIEYIDIRYRNNVFPDAKISVTAKNNIVSALNKISARLYNESDNLQHYGEEETDRTVELYDLITWASEDLATKTVYGNERHVCSKCGGDMVYYRGLWSCTNC